MHAGRILGPCDKFAVGFVSDIARREVKDAPSGQDCRIPLLGVAAFGDFFDQLNRKVSIG
jgi:hypothetical protein